MSNFFSSSSWLWLSRFRSSKYLLHRTLHTITATPRNTAPTSNLFNSHRSTNPWTTWSIPLALALSAGSLSLQPHYDNSFSDSFDSDNSGVRIGGKGSTQYVVKGSQKEFPQELLQELKIICEDNISLDYDERYMHGKPQYSFHQAVNIPDVIVYPRSEEEVSKIVKSCNNHKV
ncbi:D-lactate dehydrogenase [Trifolium pratense]|uniref:D-lactate dehydrogenase n=1 Tax=Trifolium pratense TaxID=57577 RepID=A0A2K3NER0_TRIPR|nr:D-lactate dehydrogenase [Trifolium pratense]